MVAIKDMEMPSCCMNCELLGKEEMYCSKHPRKDLDIVTVATNRPSWCTLIEIEERKVGKWIAERDDYGNITGWHCSNCYDKTGFYTTCAWDYCPNCGAEMRGAEDD